MRKVGGAILQNNNNNDNTYPMNDALNCTGCGTSKCNKDDINRSRSISMQRSCNINTGTVLTSSHCFDEHQPVVKSQRSRLHRSRSKTVATNLCDNRCESVDPLRISKRKTSQIRGCAQSNVTSLNQIDRRSPYTDADLINGNILTAPCTESTTVTPRIICRNRSRTSTTKCVQSSSSTCGMNKTNNNSTIPPNPSMKRGKRTLSSTQIEREKSDEKNIKLKKHAVLRSLSPILVTTSARSSIKKIISTSNTK